MSMDLKGKIAALSLKYNFRATPVLDQIFVVDQGLIDREARYAELGTSDTVLEIGPGLGFLTERLARLAGRVVAIEKDKRLEPVLEGEFKDQTNVEFVFEDCLKVEFPRFNKLVSNLPYSISAPLTFKLLDYDFDKAILCYQREFAEKMLEHPGSPNYGRLSVMVQYYFNPKILERVPRSAFYPQPQVESAVVELTRKKVGRNPGFDNFIREIFRYPNKDVRNAVKLGTGKDIADDRKLRTLGLPELEELFRKVA
jgi:16S rRNA (adenine1518-N6/adenine1519-N6)-dimethyltransferase